MIVEVWSAERVGKSEQLGGGTARQRAQLSTARPPVRVTELRVTSTNGPVDFGRSMNSVVQIGDNGTDTKVSRNALNLLWHGDRPGCVVRQSGGAYVQVWGSSKSWLACDEWVPLRALPMSFRIDTACAFYWILCCPEPGDLPVDTFELPVHTEGDITDERRGPRFPEGSEDQRDLLAIEDQLTVLYGEYLEWPPHLNAQTHRAKLSQEERRKVIKLRGAATNFGFRIESPHNLTDPDFIEWLTESGNLSFDYLRMTSTMGRLDEAWEA
ncbi:hypothetical protein ACFWFQ_15850 [Nocardia salmonicida]|uniref:hypothetical protein n=1 Tax=Nocardia salmonicida TaxID=53431 RepID=UPI00364ECBE0